MIHEQKKTVSGGIENRISVDGPHATTGELHNGLVPACLSDCGRPCASNSVAVFIILPPSRTVKETGSTKHREVWTSTNQSKIKHQWIMKICVLRCIIECFHCQTCFCCKTWAAGHCTMEFVLWRGPGWESFSDVFHCTVELLLLCGFGDKSYSGFVVFRELKSLIFLLEKKQSTVRFVAKPAQEH